MMWAIYRFITKGWRAISIVGWQIANHMRMKLMGIHFGNNSKFRGLVNFRCEKKGGIIIGNGYTVNSGKKQNPVGLGSLTSLWTYPAGHIWIGNHVQMSNVSIVSMLSIRIEDNVLIGNGAVVYDTDFHSHLYSERCKEYDTDISMAEVIIRSGAFIGAGCIVLKGVEIGQRSIIGAGSVITKSIPAYEIWAGNPAKQIGTVDH